VTAHRLGFLPTRPAVVSAGYGNVLISDTVVDAVTAVMHHFEAGATWIRVSYLEPVA